MNKLFCPSMMCADFSNLAHEVKRLDEAGIDIFHCDVMDGSYVGNFALGPYDIEAIRKNTNKMVDVHLMVDNPSKNIDLFIDLGVDLIYIHPESEKYTSKTLSYIKSKNVLAGIAINPDTSVSTILPLLGYVDYICVMTVNPGYAGQKFIDSTIDKIIELEELKSKYGYKLVADGAISPKVIEDLSKLGVDGFVLGTSTLFNKNQSYKEIMKTIRV